MFFQRTIRKRVTVEGIGIHTGKAARLNFCPAPANTGVHFKRTDLKGQPSLRAHVSNVQATGYATTLGGPDFSVSTVEHCLSTLSALRIDNLTIELDGPEIPIGDGSALPFYEALSSAGFIELDYPRQYLYIQDPIFFGDDQKNACVVPYNGLRISFTIDFPHPKVGHQTLDLDINVNTFARDIAPARTFGFLKDVQALQSRGLALGGSLDNAIVLDDEKVLNPEGLRFVDEFVRHKVLDALGDLVNLGYPLMGHVRLIRAGHDLTNKFIAKILESKNSYKLVEVGTDPVEAGQLLVPRL